MSGEGIIAAGLVVLGLVMAVKAAVSYDGFAMVGPGLLGGAAVLAVLAVLRQATRPVGGRYISVVGHAHGDGARREVARHEGGHAVAARRLGGRVLSAEVSADGRSGLVQARFRSNDPVPVIAFLLAGQRAVGTSRGAGADNALIRGELARLPSRDRGRVRREADAKARSITFWNGGAITADANRLMTRGRL